MDDWNSRTSSFQPKETDAVGSGGPIKWKMDMLQLDHLQSLPNTFMYYIDRSKLKKTFDQVERPIWWRRTYLLIQQLDPTQVLP
jgi:hypothetical protein